MTFLEKTQTELTELKTSLMKGDIKDCAKEVGRNNVTLSKYLKGEGNHVDTAIKIIKFLKKRISEREKSIA